MSYIGNNLTIQQYAPQIAYFSGNGSTTVFTLPVGVVSAAQILVVVNNVPQNPSSAFTVSGNTLTFASAPSSGTNNVWVEYTSLQTNTIQPSAGTVNSAQLGTITTIPVAGANIVVPQVAGTAMISGNMPTFFGYQNSNQSVPANTYTKINLQATLFDTASAFNTSTSRFQPVVAGYYQINAAVGTTTVLATSVYYDVFIAKNGNAYAQTTAFGSPANYLSAFIGSVVYLNGSTDYVELYGQSNSAYTTLIGSTNTFLNGSLVRAA